MGAVRRAPEHVVSEPVIRRDLEPLESCFTGIDERRLVVDDGRRYEVREIHLEYAELRVPPSVHRAQLEASFVTLRRFRIEHTLVLGQAEIERRRLEGIPVVGEEAQVIHTLLPEPNHCADAS